MKWSFNNNNNKNSSTSFCLRSSCRTDLSIHFQPSLPTTIWMFFLVTLTPSSSTFYYETDHRKYEITLGGWHSSLRLFILGRPLHMGFEPRSLAWLACSTGQSANWIIPHAGLVVKWESELREVVSKIGHAESAFTQGQGPDTQNNLRLPKVIRIKFTTAGCQKDTEPNISTTSNRPPIKVINHIFVHPSWWIKLLLSKVSTWNWVSGLWSGSLCILNPVASRLLHHAER